MDTPFLRELVAFLTTTSEENAAYVSGIQLGRFRILTRIIPVAMHSTSIVHANARSDSCAEVLIQLVETDLPLVAMAHSHPGMGPESTRPSGVDLSYMGTVQKNGAKVVGLIVTRDHCVRFFSSTLPFEVHVQGNEFQAVNDDENIYQLVQKKARRLHP